MIRFPRTWRLACLALTLLLPAPIRAQNALLDAYPPHGELAVTAGGRPLHVWRGQVSTETTFRPRPHRNQTTEVGFVVVELGEPMEFEVRVARPALTAVAIKPDRHGVAATVSGNTVRFRLDRPGNYIVELNQSAFDHLYVFANAPEKDAPRPKDPKVIYFGPGLHRPGVIELTQDGQTVYLAEGAVVRARIRAKDRRNIAIRGRGILDAVDEPDRANPILIESCENVRISDLVILNARGWTVRLNDSRRLHLEGLRQICSHQNSDGIDPLNCEDVVIRNTFQRVYDDAIVVKTMNGGSSRRILAEGCILICDHATPLKVGANEMLGKEVRDVTFRDCDILYSCATGHLSIMNHGTAAISNVRFEDIRIENSRVNLMGVKSGLREMGLHLFLVYVTNKNVYAARSGEAFTPGSVRGVVFRNISYHGDPGAGVPLLSRVEGLGETHLVEDVLFENIVLNGTVVTDGAAAGFRINNFARNVRFHAP